MSKKKKGNNKGSKHTSYKKVKKAVSAHNQKTEQEAASTINKQQPASTIKNIKQPAQANLGIQDGKATLVFKAIDTLFFRESRPMEAMGELQSIFPPTMQTLAGAVRTYIGNSQAINWADFDANHALTKWIGYGDDLGALNLQGSWLALDGQRLYPAPLVLMQKEQKETIHIHRLSISEQGIRCDLGKNVRLPYLPDEAQGSKPMENTWLTQSGLNDFLQGKIPNEKDIKQAKDLFKTESRVGIARDNTTRTVKQSMLYQTEHIRPNANLSIEVDATGLPDDLLTSGNVRLGGEGRCAHLSLEQKPQQLSKAPAISHKTKGLILTLLTPLQFKQTKERAPLPDFQQCEGDGTTYWMGELNGIELKLHSAVTGKAIRQGGWDLVKHQPCIMNSLIPAGSSFFCTTTGDLIDTIKALHNTQIGERQAYGLGHVVTGLWL